MKTGADLVCDILVAHGINTCFANPGTSEMHFVAALDKRTDIRCVLGLSEGVVTGAADGYGRMTDKPAATLLHLGPGLANGMANIHNARRARTPMVNIVGDHASTHLRLDAPLTTNIDALAHPVSDWVGRAAGPADLRDCTREACRAAIAARGISTLILPADVAWSAAVGKADRPIQNAASLLANEQSLKHATAALRSGRRVAVLLGGVALREDALADARALAKASYARILAETTNARIERGAGRFGVERVPYDVDLAVRTLHDIDILLLVGAKAPVAFFAYPGKPGSLVRPDCEVIPVADAGEDVRASLAFLAAQGYGSQTRLRGRPPDLPADAEPDAALSPDSIAAAVARLMPEGSIVCDEALTSAGNFYARSYESPPHDYLALTGGAIGIGIPLSTGAAIASPDRRVISLQADGSGMYTLQGLWTQARENLDVVTVVYANRAYRILEGELKRVGVTEAGPNARRMLELSGPNLDWVSLARGLGVDGARVETTANFAAAFKRASAGRGPYLIEAII